LQTSNSDLLPQIAPQIPCSHTCSTVVQVLNVKQLPKQSGCQPTLPLNGNAYDFGIHRKCSFVFVCWVVFGIMPVSEPCNRQLAADRFPQVRGRDRDVVDEQVSSTVDPPNGNGLGPKKKSLLGFCVCFIVKNTKEKNTKLTLREEIKSSFFSRNSQRQSTKLRNRQPLLEVRAQSALDRVCN
jgi:hypothetical protein